MDLIAEAEAYVRDFLRGNADGHDADHTLRVYRTAVRLAEAEGADPETAALAALLHDVDDRKLSPETAQTKENAVAFLRGHGVPEAEIREIVSIIGAVSFRGTDSVVPETAAGKCVQDADRLDAIGAVGIARAFAYGGSHGRRLYDPAAPHRSDLTDAEYRASASDTVSHFYEKLLLLKDRMNTETGRRLAARRHAFVEEFLEEFYGELGEDAQAGSDWGV